MEQVLLVIQVLLAIGLIGIVLIQRSDSDGMGLGGGSGSNFLTGRAAANVLTRTTAIFATLFIINSLVLSVLASQHGKSSIAERAEQVQSETPATPVVPLAGAKETGKPVEERTKTEAPAVSDVSKDKPEVPVGNATPTKPASDEAEKPTKTEAKKVMKKEAAPAASFDPNALKSEE